MHRLRPQHLLGDLLEEGMLKHIKEIGFFVDLDRARFLKEAIPRCLRAIKLPGGERRIKKDRTLFFEWSSCACVITGRLLSTRS